MYLPTRVFLYLQIMARVPAITSFLDQVLLHAQNPAAMKAAHRLLGIVTSNSEFADAREDHDVLADTLEDMGFEGLQRSHSFLQAQEFDKQLIGLTEKLIEVSLTSCARTSGARFFPLENTLTRYSSSSCELFEGAPCAGVTGRVNSLIRIQYSRRTRGNMPHSKLDGAI